MFVYDFKFDDLSKIVYNTWLKYRSKYPVQPEFYVINFDDLTRSHRCNPLDHATMSDITDVAESARTILMGLNKEWIKRQGDFFVESPINFLTAIIWYLRKYNDGGFCTLPHVIELMQVDYDSLFTALRTETEIDVLINPFGNAYLNEVMEQLEGQIAAAKVAYWLFIYLKVLVWFQDTSFDVKTLAAIKRVTIVSTAAPIASLRGWSFAPG